MKVSIILFGWLSALTLAPPVAGQRLEWEVQSGDTVRQFYSMARPEWTLDEALAVSGVSAPRRFRQVRFEQLTSNHVPLPWTGATAHAPLEGRRSEYLSGRWKRFTFTELIQVNSATVARHRGLDGKIERRVIGGGDPLRIEVRGRRVEIVHVSFRCGLVTWQRFVKTDSRGPNVLAQRTIRLNFTDQDHPIVLVTVTSGSWPPADAPELASEILGHLGLDGGTAVLRPDHWFYENLRTAELFLPVHESPPPVSYHLEVPSIRCGYQASVSGMRCHPSD